MRLLSLLLFCLATLAHPGGLGAEDRASSVDETLSRVATIHGAADVFAVAGYRMGERALHDLSAQRGNFALDVTHRTPLEVQYSCIADGWQAATGVSAGKLICILSKSFPTRRKPSSATRKPVKPSSFACALNS